MSGRTLLAKLGRRPTDRLLLVAAPPDVVELLVTDPTTTTLVERPPPPPGGNFDAIHVFLRTQDELHDALPTLRAVLAPGGRLWASWPKGRPPGCDLTLREVIRLAYDAGLVESTTLAIDPVWSAIKLTHPIPGKQYRNSYGTLRRR